MVTIYHNPRCSKSRETLALLENKGVKFNIINYLDSPPSASTLKQLLKKLGLDPRQLLRKNEDAYKELGLNDTSLSQAQLIAAMIKYPKLIERPIVVNGDRAALGRPPENILNIL